MGFTALEGCYGTLAFSFTTLGSRKASGHGIYLFVVFVGMFPMQLLAFAFHLWIKTRKNTAVVVFSLIASGLLLTAYVASILYCVWPRITVDPLDTSIPVIFFLLWAWPLWWAFIASARRLRLLTRAPRG